MKKVIAGVLCGVMLLGSSITVKANSLSYREPSEQIPMEIIEYSEIVGHEFNICPELLQSIAYHESRFNPEAKNGNCIGLMQVNKSAHSDKLTAQGWTSNDLYKPYINMYIAGEVLSELFEQYEDPGEVILRYNGAATALKTYKESGKLSTYANNVLTMSEELERQHQK